MPTSTKNKKEILVNFKLNAIELLNTCLNHPKHAISDLKVFHFDIKIVHKLDVENKLIAVIICIDLFNEQRDLKLGSITASCIFEIANIIDFVDTKSNNISLPDDFLITINAITISTARGIMFDQFKGTFLHHAYLPIVDPKSFITQK
jgi:hypothetical protein